jgi:SAM-dependent methyltransferase
VSFDVSADAYGRFMGRYSEPLAAGFVELTGVSPGQRALDVGCGPGALTAQLVRILGPKAVAALDPSPSFVAAIRARFPGVDVREGTAERLPFEDDSFDAAAAQLVVHFLSDPVVGLREMARVVRPGGIVAACVWDHAGGGGPLSAFWAAARELDPGVADEADRPGAREGHLIELSHAAGLPDVEASTVSVRAHFATFDDWWVPFTLGVGPAGAHVARLDEPGRAALRERCERRLPDAPFDIVAAAWCVRARVGRAGADSA